MSLKHKNLILIFALLFSFMISGCAPARFALLKDDLVSGRSEGRYIEGVAFVEQEKNWCGPASLASVVGFWGKPESQGTIAEKVYLKSARGTLTVDMEGYASKLGFWSSAYEGSVEDAKEKLSMGIPLITLQKSKKYFFVSKNHYLVLLGYDDKRRCFIAHTGRKENEIIPYKKFIKSWKRADFWTLVTCPPEKVSWQLDSDGFNRLGILFEEKGMLGDAIQSYNRSLAEEENERVFFNLGNACGKKEQFEDAITAYENALNLDPDYADCYNNLAYIYVILGKDLVEAKKYIEHAIRLNSDGAMYYLDTLGLIQFKMGLYIDALNTFEKAKDAAGDNIQIVKVINEHMDNVRTSAIEEEVALLDEIVAMKEKIKDVAMEVDKGAEQ